MTREQSTGSRFRVWGGGIGLAMVCFALTGCGSLSQLGSTVDPRYGVSASPRVVADGQPIPKGGGVYRVGKPYKVAGKTYVPAENPDYSAEGLASWYGAGFHGRLTANGEVFDTNSISAAHPTLPMPCYVRVTNLRNNRSIIVRVNDRGPYHANRLIDVSNATADLLGFKNSGVARVRVDYVGRAPLDGSDDRKLVATLRDDGPAQAPSNSAVMVASAAPFVPSIPNAVPVTSGDGEIPFPLQRPYDLGHKDNDRDDDVQVAQAQSEPQDGSGSNVRQAFQVREQPQPPKVSSVVAAGWNVGAAPVTGLGYAGVPVYGSIR